MEASVQELQKRRSEDQQDYVLLDVREPHERDEDNIGGLHVPLGEIAIKLDELIPHKDEEVIVYCRSGKRSAMATQLLKQAGFTNVRNLEGGMLAYREIDPGK